LLALAGALLRSRGTRQRATNTGLFILDAGLLRAVVAPALRFLAAVAFALSLANTGLRRLLPRFSMPLRPAFLTAAQGALPFRRARWGRGGYKSDYGLWVHLRYSFQCASTRWLPKGGCVRPSRSFHSLETHWRHWASAVVDCSSFYSSLVLSKDSLAPQSLLALCAQSSHRG
jgi:hypothetical protein